MDKYQPKRLPWLGIFPGATWVVAPLRTTALGHPFRRPVPHCAEENCLHSLYHYGSWYGHKIQSNILVIAYSHAEKNITLCTSMECLEEAY
jgi:hypothetical protein